MKPGPKIEVDFAEAVVVVRDVVLGDAWSLADGRIDGQAVAGGVEGERLNEIFLGHDGPAKRRCEEQKVGACTRVSGQARQSRRGWGGRRDRAISAVGMGGKLGGMQGPQERAGRYKEAGCPCLGLES